MAGKRTQQPIIRSTISIWADTVQRMRDLSDRTKIPQTELFDEATRLVEAKYQDHPLPPAAST